MRNTIILLTTVLFCQTIACSCQNPTDGQNTKENQLLWTSGLSQTLISGIFPKFIYQNSIISQAKKNGILAIIAIDLTTKKELWVWNDTFDDEFEPFTNFVHVYQNILVWRRAGRVYAINLNNGKTVWKERAQSVRGWSLGNAISGVGNRFLFHSSDKEYFSGYTQTGNIRQYPTLATPARTIHSATKVFLNAQPNFLENATLNDTIAILPFGNTLAGICFTVFNLTQNKAIYTKTILGDSSGATGPPPLLQNGILYFDAGSFIYAFDLKTGNQLWREQFPSQFSFSGILYYDGMIIGNCEDTFMYALDATTGKQLWATKTAGTSSRLFEMNGVIYFTGGGDGLLYAIDAKTGKNLWKRESPDLQRNSGASFFDSVTGADGKIYVSSYLSLFCYKAAR
jgi:outer membrane protein assembly factor BamB